MFRFRGKYMHFYGDQLTYRWEYEEIDRSAVK